jgi:hypothetical protein
MEGRVLLVIPCINRRSCFHQNATDLDVSILRSDMEGRMKPAMPVSCIDRCSSRE